PVLLADADRRLRLDQQHPGGDQPRARAGWPVRLYDAWPGISLPPAARRLARDGTVRGGMPAQDAAPFKLYEPALYTGRMEAAACRARLRDRAQPRSAVHPLFALRAAVLCRGDAL